MQASWRFALNSLTGKPGRTVLMVAAVAVACSLVVAVSCAIASVQESMELGFTKVLGATDARIIHQGNGRFDEELIEQSRGWAGVKAVTGRLISAVTLTHEDERANPQTGNTIRATPTAIGVEWSEEGVFNSTEVVEGAMPKAADEILIDSMCQKELKAKVGDRLTIQRFGDPITLKVAGIFKRYLLGAIQRPMIRIDRRMLAEASDLGGEVTAVYILLEEGVDVEAFCAIHGGELPKIVTLEPADKWRSGLDKQIDAGQFGFYVGSILTFICASFIIVTALTTAVTERQREMAVTRCIGASRGQVFGGQVMVGAILGALGCAVGIPLGIGLTAALTWWYAANLPAGLAIHGLGLQLAVTGSFSAGILGALYPAWTASRVSPLAAMTMRSKPPHLIRATVGAAAVFGVLTAAQAALFQIPESEGRFFAYMYAGMPALLLGYFVSAIAVLIVVTPVLSAVISKVIGIPSGMLRRSILGMPYRNGFTAGALMVGMCFLVSTWSNSTSLLSDWLGNIKLADAFAYRNTGIPPAQQEAIAKLPMVTEACPIGYLSVRVAERQLLGVSDLAPNSIICFGFDPDLFFAMNAVKWSAGEQSAAIEKVKAGEGLLISSRFLNTNKVKIGDKMTLATGRAERRFEIVGAVDATGLEMAVDFFGVRNQYMEISTGSVFVDWNTVRATFDSHDAYAMLLNLKEGVTDAEAREAVLKAAPGVDFQTSRGITDTLNDVALGLLVVQSTIAFAALVLASIGMGNVILANIHTRRFEYGVLRAVGAGAGVLVKVILAEAMVIALVAAVVGIGLGLHLAAMGAFLYRDLLGLPVRFIVPVLPTLAGVVVLLVLTCVVAMPGARRMAKWPPSALLAGGRNG